MSSFFIYTTLILALSRLGGMKFSLETTIFGEENLMFRTTIMQKGEKIRVEETLPNSEEIGLVLISDSKECWYIPAVGKVSQIPPIKSALEVIGIEQEALKKDIGIKAKEIPATKALKKEVAQEIVRYKEYMETEEMGQLPKVIEVYDLKDKLQKRTVILNLEEDLNLSDELFDKNKVTFSDKAKEIAKKSHFE